MNPPTKKRKDTRPALRSRSEAGPLNILVAEDNAVSRKVVGKRLDSLGHRVTEAADGREAVELFERGSFDLVIMDLQMPVIDGFEATLSMRRIESGSGREPCFICAMTAQMLEADRDACRRCGMDDCIPKPFSPEQLDAVIWRGEEAAFSTGGEAARAAAPGGLTAYLDGLPPGDRRDVLAAGAILVRNLPADIHAFEEALEGGGLEEISFRSHAFKAVAGVFNAPAVHDYSEAIEDACRSGDLAAVRDTAGRLTAFLRGLARELGQLLADGAQ